MSENWTRLTYEKAERFTKCKKCKKSDKLVRYIEIHEEELQAYNPKTKEWIALTTSFQGFGDNRF